MNAIKSLCYSQTFLSSTEVKDCLETVKKSEGPQINKDGSFNALLANRNSFVLDRRLRSSSRTAITRRETGLVDSLCTTALFDFSTSDDKRERPNSAGTTKLTFPSK